MSNTIVINQKNTAKIPVSFSVNGTDVDITGATVYFTVKKFDDLGKDDDSDIILQKEITGHDAPTEGDTTISLTKVETDIEAGNYAYDIVLEESDGTITSTGVGYLVINQSVK